MCVYIYIYIKKEREREREREREQLLPSCEAPARPPLLSFRSVALSEVPGELSGFTKKPVDNNIRE